MTAPCKPAFEPLLTIEDVADVLQCSPKTVQRRIEAARSLLGHRSSATTERYYITAHQLKAAQSVARVLQDVWDNPGDIHVPDA